MGSWECTNFKDLIVEVGRSEGVSQEQIDAALAMMGDFDISVVFDKDGTFSMKLAVMGESQEFTGTWKANDKGVDVTIEDETQTFLWDGSKLTLSGDAGLGLGETTLVFEKK